MIVRVYVPSWEDLRAISLKPLDIAAGSYGEWYDLVVDRNGLDMVLASGLPYEVTVHSLELEKEKYRGTYLSYTQINDSLRHLALNYPSLCKFDSLPFRTYENRWIYGVKISDNVNVEETDEPNFSIDGCHHSREWATPQAVLFFADSMLQSYSTVPEIAEIVNTTQIYCFPLINVDGYVYDYPGQLSWRKNREPFGGAIGTDPNRNYGASCNGELPGEWGAVDESQGAHYPSDETFCGAFAFSGNEVAAYAKYIRDHRIITGFSLHSYGQQVMWCWGYKQQGTPDSLLYTAKGNYMASLMQRLSGGTYTPGQSWSNPYPTSGSARDWIYGYNKWMAGISTLFFGSEIGTSFYQPQGDLDFISLQVFKAAKYLAGFSDSLVLVAEGFVPPPQIYPIGNVGANYTVYWHAKNSYDNHPTHWELVEFSNPSVKVDSLESGTGRWMLEGFTLSTTQVHSPTHSLFSGNVNEMNSGVRSLHPYPVQAGDSLTFWCWYNLEANWDVAVVEVSENTKEWFNADTMRYSGNSGGWIRKAVSLAPWVGKSIHIQFRSMTDGNTLNSGFYVDDISPSCLFANVTTVSSSIPDTFYAFSGHALGEYFYHVRGYNTPYGWGEYSCLEDADVLVGVSEEDRAGSPDDVLSFKVSPNPFHDRTILKYHIPAALQNTVPAARFNVYGADGRLVRSLISEARKANITWRGDDDNGHVLPAGIYFCEFDAGGSLMVEKIIKLR
jgi:hypothetical protein